LKELHMADNKGIIDPPIDELLTKIDSKYGLVIFASKRARQINDYYADLHEGSLFDNVGPLVESSIDDKPLSVALREINEDKLSITADDKLPVDVEVPVEAETAAEAQ
jgi:DNA-directed RNA polymerase subunit omega